MNDFKEILEEIKKFITNRLFILTTVFILVFAILVTSLFSLQIVNGSYYYANEKPTTTKTILVAAPRGEIFDAYGRPLAINSTAFTVKIDTSIPVADQNTVLLNFIKLMDKNEEEISLPGDFPLSQTLPREFIVSESAVKRWKKDMDFKPELTAEETYAQLIKLFKIKHPEDFPEDTLYKLLSLRSAIYIERWRFNPLTVAMGIKEETVAAIEEKNEDYQGFYIDLDYLRSYPEGKYVSHMLGYIRGISSEELDIYGDLGYESTDLFGKSGIELAFESQLKGDKGAVNIEVNSSGRRVGSTQEVSPKKGDDIYLTIDVELTKEIYHILEDTLTQILLNRMKGVSSRDSATSVKELLISMVNSYNISGTKIMASPDDDSVSSKVKAYVLNNSQLDLESKTYKADLNAVLAEGIESGAISVNQMLTVLYEQGIITLSGEESIRLQNGSLSALNFIISKIEQKQITPQNTNMEPCTGSIVVTDVNTGAVLAAVNYPTYDNNEFVNSFNSAYYTKQLEDTTKPMYNRAFSELRAPGSTFKMITALAALDTGTITTSTKIYDKGTFTEAKKPYASCWIARSGGSHEQVDVRHALEVSCNYFFFQASYNLGTRIDSSHSNGIDILNEYMRKFGLGQPTGVEIGEASMLTDEGVQKIASPEYKKYLGKGAWSDADTIRAAIGQSDNNYTSAMMAKYVATLANGGTRYKMHLADKIQSADGDIITKFDPVVEEEIDIKPEYLNAIFEGMLAVTSGSSGTARTVFSDFPMKVAGKTGTAQQGDESDHGSFTCFAPYDDPQIAVYLMVPYGNTSFMSSPAVQMAKKVLNAYFNLDSEPETGSMNNSLVQ